MKLLSLLKELSLYPKNAEELKGLILQLAVQGKLTSNWRVKHSDIESASNLLYNIEVKKQELIANKKIRKEKVLPSIGVSEHPFSIPDSWSYCRMGDLFSMSTGKGYKKSEYSDSGVRLFQIANVTFGETSWDIKVHLPESYMENYPTQILKPNDLVMALNRPLLGKKLKIAKLSDKDTPAIIYQRVGRFDYHHVNLSDWHLLYLQSPIFIDWLLDQIRGINIPFVNQTKLYQHITVLPPLEEQKAIVEVVNQLFTEVDQLENLTMERIQLKEDYVTSALKNLCDAYSTTEQWNNLQQHFSTFFTETNNIKKLRETILQLAVQGKLSAQWRENNPVKESAQELLNRITKEKNQLIADKKIKKEKPLPPIEEEDKPYKLPDGWEWCRLGVVTDIIAGASFKSGDFNDTGGTKCIKITNAGVREFVETNDFLPKEFLTKYPNYLIKEGDLILALTRPYIKDGLKISTCPGSYHNSLLNQRVASIRSMSNGVYHPYVFTFIQSPRVLNHYKSMFDGKSQQPNMKMGDITELVVSIPPLEEQQVIVEKVNSLMVLCDELEQQIDNSQTQIEQLMQSCLKEVFEVA